MTSVQSPGVSKRGQISSFIVMDLMQQASIKQHQLEESGIYCVFVYARVYGQDDRPFWLGR
jgi:hypothetical protein